MNKIDLSLIKLEFIKNSDLDFLYQVYKDSRIEELGVIHLEKELREPFLKHQFDLQHRQYMGNYKNPSFQIILFNNEKIGRLYINKNENEIRIIDIAIFKKYQKKGIGGKLIKNIINEADNNNLKLSLHVEYDNPIIPFYKKIGFSLIEDKGVYHYMERESK